MAKRWYQRLEARDGSGAVRGPRRAVEVPPVEGGESSLTRRYLPHWQIGGSIYFVSFHTRGITLPDPACQIVLDACRYWHGTRIRLHIACVMHTHVHSLIEPLEQSPGHHYNLSKILHSIKSFSAHEVNRLLARSGPVWELESWDRIVRDQQDYAEIWQYILANPVDAGLVEDPYDYPFLWHQGMAGA